LQAFKLVGNTLSNRASRQIREIQTHGASGGLTCSGIHLSDDLCQIVLRAAISAQPSDGAPPSRCSAAAGNLMRLTLLSKVSKAWLATCRMPQLWTAFPRAAPLALVHRPLSMKSLLGIVKRPQFALLANLTLPPSVKLGKNGATLLANACPALQTLDLNESLDLKDVDMSVFAEKLQVSSLDVNLDLRVGTRSEKPHLVSMAGVCAFLAARGDLLTDLTLAIHGPYHFDPRPVDLAPIALHCHRLKTLQLKDAAPGTGVSFKLIHAFDVLGRCRQLTRASLANLSTTSPALPLIDEFDRLATVLERGESSLERLRITGRFVRVDNTHREQWNARWPAVAARLHERLELFTFPVRPLPPPQLDGPPPAPEAHVVGLSDDSDDSMDDDDTDDESDDESDDDGSDDDTGDDDESSSDDDDEGE